MDDLGGLRGHALPVLALGLALLLPRAAPADLLTNYTAQVIARPGDKAGDVVFTDFFTPGRLNDKGQLVFTTHQANHSGALIQFSDGRFTVVARAGGPAPGWKTWPSPMDFWPPVSMNEAGDIAFDPGVAPHGSPDGVWLWDHRSQQVTIAADKGTLVDGNLDLSDAGGPGWATINNHGEIALAGYFKNPMGQERTGVLARSADGRFRAVALPGDALPENGGVVIDAFLGFINDAGLVAFTATSKQEPLDAAYLWDEGTIRVMAAAGTVIPGLGKIAGAGVLGLNNHGSALIAAAIKANAPTSLFLWKQGQFTPVAVPGQDMPGGGIYVGEWPEPIHGFSSAAGAFPFLGHVEENDVPRTAAYLVGPDGKLSLILKTGMMTNLGTITGIATSGTWGIGLNSQGQVALPAQIEDGPGTLLLLTPSAP